jgi:hypothetical protein
MPQLAEEEFIFQQDSAPTTLACAWLGASQWKPITSMDWSCISCRQYLLHMATPVTRPDSVWFLPLGFHQGQCLLPPTSEHTHTRPWGLLSL